MNNITWDLFLLDNQTIINYVTNQIYIIKASKCRQIQVSYLLNLIYEFEYPMAVNITKHNNIYHYIHLMHAGCQLFISIRRVQIIPSYKPRVEHLLLHTCSGNTDTLIHKSQLSWISSPLVLSMAMMVLWKRSTGFEEGL